MVKPLKKTSSPRLGVKRKKSIKGTSKVKKAPSITKLIKEADRIFSLKVRMKGAWKPEGSDEWWNRCFTNGYVAPIKKLHAGHYLSRMFKSARWDFDNARPQCFGCNIMQKGDAVAFRQNLIEEIGEERVKAVEAKRFETVKLTREYLNDLIEKLSTS